MVANGIALSTVALILQQVMVIVPIVISVLQTNLCIGIVLPLNCVTHRDALLSLVSESVLNLPV